MGLALPSPPLSLPLHVLEARRNNQFGLVALVDRTDPTVRVLMCRIDRRCGKEEKC
jgi:hypothetical protein